MLTIQRYKQSDVKQVDILMADTFHTFKLSELTTKQQEQVRCPVLYFQGISEINGCAFDS